MNLLSGSLFQQTFSDFKSSGKHSLYLLVFPSVNSECCKDVMKSINEPALAASVVIYANTFYVLTKVKLHYRYYLFKKNGFRVMQGGDENYSSSSSRLL